MTKPADRIRLRFRELMLDAQVSQSALCVRLRKRTGDDWRDSRMSKILNGVIAWEVNDLLLMAEEAGISLIDLFREPGREFVADLTPTELRIIHAMRDNPAIVGHLSALILALTPPKRKPPRQILRERMRQARADE